MKTIDTLATDIEQLFRDTLRGESFKFNEEMLAMFGVDMALAVQRALEARRSERTPNTLRMSEIGKPCLRQIWYGVHHADLGEKMLPHTLFKFLYGDVLEELVILLAKAAGHRVEGEQQLVEYRLGDWKVRGKQDAVIDSVLTDVKSASSFAFQKFKKGLDDSNDDFGYRLQLSGYNGWSVPIWKRQGFLAVDKQNGHIHFSESAYIPVEPKVEVILRAVDNDAKEPKRGFELVPEGKSGNEKLCTNCSYCPYKVACWRDANDGEGLKGYVYSNGPVFLGTVKREPAVPRLTFDEDPKLIASMEFDGGVTLSHPAGMVLSAPRSSYPAP